MKRLQKYDLFELFALMGFALLMVILFIALVGMITTPAMAQDTTTQQWEYAVLFFSPDDAVSYTSDLAATHEMNKLLVDDNGESVDIITALDVLGMEGWELVDVTPGATSLYLFKRPVD